MYSCRGGGGASHKGARGSGSQRWWGSGEGIQADILYSCSCRGLGRSWALVGAPEGSREASVPGAKMDEICKGSMQGCERRWGPLQSRSLTPMVTLAHLLLLEPLPPFLIVNQACSSQCCQCLGWGETKANPLCGAQKGWGVVSVLSSAGLEDEVTEAK